MKQLFVLLVLFFAVNVASAQSCCKDKKVASADQSIKACAGMATVEASSIQKRIDNATGAVTYFEKAVDAQGAITWNKISSDEATKKMTKVASAGMEKTPTGEVKTTNMKCAPGASPSCCKDKKVVN